VSFDFLGYAFRPRDTIGKYSRFTGLDLAVSPKAIKRMNAVVSGWRLHRHTGLTWEQRAWDRITAQTPGLLPHWRWETGAWY
jgi:hypothetical protein